VKIEHPKNSDSDWMQKALDLAAQVKGYTLPNPAVGAIILKNSQVIATGVTSPAGGDHAEAAALKSAGEAARGACVVVTLEPCSHYGRTPPCALALINAGVARVVVGTEDPNPLVAGKGVAMLKAAGIEVVVGVLAAQCKHFYRGFFSYILKGRPFVTLKIAQSLDGYIARHRSVPEPITGEEARVYVHKLRSLADAVLVGGATVEADDPLLDVRTVQGKNPLRVIMAQRRVFAKELRVFRPDDAGYLVFSAVAQPLLDSARVCKLESKEFAENWQYVLAELGRRGMHELLVEPGAELAAGVLQGEQWDSLVLITAPKILGKGYPWMPSAGFSWDKWAKLSTFEPHGRDVAAVFYR
jgi:diaminohydroxyphosphoribosylaminopyrimidine deaminase / 5-amino-6-(5-phosphoribosylamino)uracil reductase